MKIRIKGNRVRLRLTKTDIQDLRETGTIEERTIFFPDQIFEYKLSRMDDAEELSAVFESGKVHVILPTAMSEILTDSDEIGVEGYQNNGESEHLFILVEKDLQCLKHAREDQSDMYENPNTDC